LTRKLQKLPVTDEWLEELETFLQMLKNKNLNLVERLRSIEKNFQDIFKKSSEKGYLYLLFKFGNVCLKLLRYAAELQVLQVDTMLLFNRFNLSKQLADCGIFPPISLDLEVVLRLIADIFNLILLTLISFDMNRYRVHNGE
jgi:hypothetical protein